MSLKLHLSRLRNYIDESNLTNSNNDKIAVLEQFRDDKFVTKVFHYTYNNQLQFNISVENLKKNAGICAPENMYNAEGQNGDNLFALLDDLHNRNITGHAAISCVNAFIKEYAEFERELHFIIDRNLQTRVTSTIINKVIKGLIPEFEVALGTDYDSLDETIEKALKMMKSGEAGTRTLQEVKNLLGKKYDKRPDICDGDWLTSRKMDGLRGVALVDDNGDATLKSREGNVFTAFQPIIDMIKQMGFKNCVLDGEICLITDDGQDDFHGIQKEFRKKDHTIKNARYRLFDMLTFEEFNSRKSTVKLSERLERLKAYTYNSTIMPLEQIRFTNQEELDNFRIEAEAKGWEGLISRKDIGYEGRRTKHLLKLKMFKEGEYEVIGTTRSMQRVIIDGKEVTKELFEGAIIVHNGVKVKVGSGYSLEERIAFTDDENLIKGHIITVQYKKETVNEEGKPSLQFPTFKRLFEKF